MSSRDTSHPKTVRRVFGFNGDARFIFAVIGLGVLLRVIIMALARGTLIDDAYITLRYGRNLFEGKGFVFNPGEHALGAPPLYSVLAGILWKLSSIFSDGEHAAGYLLSSFNILLMGVSGLLLSKTPGLVPSFRPDAVTRANYEVRGEPVVTSPVRQILSGLPLLIFALYLPFVDNTTTGMETSLFLFLQVFSMYVLLKDRVALAMAALALTMLVRAEGVLWTIAVLFPRIAQKRRLNLRTLTPLFAIAVGWIVFSILYYGSPVPLNVLAKSGWMVSGENAGAENVIAQLRDVLTSFMLLSPAVGNWLAGGGLYGAIGLIVLLLPLLFFGIGIYALWREKSAHTSWGLFFAVCVLFYVAGRGATWPSWYAIPPGLSFFIVLSHGFAFLLPGGEHRKLVMRKRSPAGLIFLLLLALFLSLSSFIFWNRIRGPYYRLMEESYAATGRYIRDNSNRGDSLFVWEVGYIGYLADRYTQEAAGIVSPRVFRIARESRGRAGTPELIREFRPEFLVLPVEKEGVREKQFGAWFVENYRLVFKTSAYWTYKRTVPQ